MKNKNKFKVKGFDNSKVEIVHKKLDENGYLVIDCIFARTGIQERLGMEIDPNLEPMKVYKEYRSPQEVFKPSVIDGFRRVVITNDHPEELLDSTNTKPHAVGFVSSNVEVVDEKYLRTQITIYDQQTINDIQAGKIELSAGYLYSLLFVEGEEYDYIQKDIKPNHIAIVEAGRCGSACSLAFDSNSNLTKGKNGMKVTFYRHLPSGEKEVLFEIEISNEEEAKKLQSFADTLYEQSKKMVEASNAKDEDLEEAQAQNQELQKANDTLQAMVDMKKPAKDCDIVRTMALDLASVIAVAKDAGLDTKEFKTAKDLKTQVVTKYNPTIALDGKSEDYINSAYDMTVEALKGADSSFSKGLTITPHRADDSSADETKHNEAKKGFDSRFGGNE